MYSAKVIPFPARRTFTRLESLNPPGLAMRASEIYLPPLPDSPEPDGAVHCAFVDRRRTKTLAGLVAAAILFCAAAFAVLSGKLA